MMAISMRTGWASDGARSSFERAQEASQATLIRLASGNRILSAADDAAGLAIAQDMNARVRGMTAAIRNGNDGVSMLQVADGAMSSMGSLLGRMRELSVQSGNGTLNASNRKAINAEFQQLKAEIDRISKTTEFNGIKVLDGSAKGTTLQLGADANDTLEVSLGNPSSETLGLKDAGVSDPASAQMSMKAIDDAIAQLVGSRVNLGAAENRIGSRLANLTQATTDTRAAQSRIQDTDFATATTELASQNIRAQSSMAVLAQANAQAGVALGLLRP
jgi:flagellin